jgi:hypothetical protein
VETDASGLSRRLVERLKRDFPDRPETARAAIWTFVPVALLGEWMPGDYWAYSSDMIGWAILNPKATRWADTTEEDAKPPAPPAAPPEAPAIDLEEVRRQLARQKDKFDAARSTLEEDQLVQSADRLDDLISVANAPGMTFELYQRYQKIRDDRDSLPDAAGDLAPLAPWIEFRKMVRMVSRPDGFEGPFSDTVEAWDRYLADYPDGPKSEPASFRRLRLRVRAAFPIPRIRAFHFPEAPIPNGYKRLSRPPEADVEVWRSLATELDEHEKRFPHGRYHADLCILRGAVSAQVGDYRVAVRSLAEVVADRSHPELRMIAALYFAEISLRLLDKNERAGVAAAFRAEPAALPFLKNLVHGDTCLFRLRPLMRWLESPQ